jgi:putative CocE/NonD family hydrolase
VTGAPPRKRAVVEYDVPIPVRDGTVLRADIVRPDIERPVPVVLLRSPYPAAVAHAQLDPLLAARSGFAVVLQSVRGTGPSGGHFDPWAHEVADGADTVGWCAGQPWSNGRVGMFGGSYLGHVQLFAASAAPPALVAIAPTVVPSHAYDLTYEGGVLLLGSTLNWVLDRARDVALGRTPANTRTDDARSFDDLVRTTPLSDLTPGMAPLTMWQDWLDHPAHDGWWQARDVGDRPALPALFRTGWWDLFLAGTLTEWARGVRHPSSRLIIGPWSHLNESDAHGEVRYGPSASAAAQDLTGLALNFLGHHLDDRPLADGPPVRLFVMGSNVWRDEDSWPPRAVRRRLYLHPAGRLSARPPDPDAPAARFRFDPLDPVPTVGGRNLLPGSAGGYQTGPAEQSMLDGRDDILRYLGDPLPAELTVIGGLAVTLHVATTAADSDWTAKLVDVRPDGRAFNVADGIIRARFRNGTQTSEPVAPGTVHRVDIDLAATAYTFQAGHRIRLDVSSSNFPRFDRNPGTGGTSADIAEVDFVVMRQTVFLDAARPSWLDLPVVA